MQRTRYGTSLWLDRTTPRRQPAFPRATGAHETDVVVIGGGLTGCVIACQFARAGVSTTLLDAGQPAATAARDAGWLVETPGVSFRELQQARGTRDARRAFDASRRAALEAAAFLRRLSIACDLTPRQSLTLALSIDEARDLEREHQARVAAGLDAAWLSGRRVAEAARSERAVGAIKTQSEATYDPVRAGQGILAAAVEAGAVVFERSPAHRIKAGARSIDVTIEGGMLRARTAILATGAPRPLVPALQRHVRVVHSYQVATTELPRALQARLPADAILRDVAEPAHTVARVAGGRLLVQGGDQPAVAARLADKALVQRTGQLMYELSLLYPAISGVLPEYAWAAPRVTGRDGLMLVGPHRNFPRHLFALGLDATGLAGAWLASRILLRHHTGEIDAGDEVFGFARCLG